MTVTNPDQATKDGAFIGEAVLDHARNPATVLCVVVYLLVALDDLVGRQENRTQLAKLLAAVDASCPRYIAHGSSKLPCENCGRPWEAHPH